MAVAEGWLYAFTPLQPAIERFDQFARSYLLTDQPFFPPNLWILAFFIGVLALNAVRLRFWCRYLCPLGALFAILARFSIIKHHVDSPKCIACERCAEVCHTVAIHSGWGFTASAGECTACLECVEVCPTGAIAFTQQLRSAPIYDLSRREFLTTGVFATLGAALIPVVPDLDGWQLMLVRPPGATVTSMLNQCIRCGECIKVCPTGGLQPSLSWGNWSGLWTPRLAARLGYCDYSCNSCGLVCPTGTIPMLPLDEKRRTVIGIAHIDEKRCIPFAENRDCLVCEEMCPVSDKAVVLEAEPVINDSGQLITVRRPRVIEDRCIGCGICETKCPVKGDSAIIVYPQKTTA